MKCGSPLLEGAAFCTRCGTPIAQDLQDRFREEPEQLACQQDAPLGKAEGERTGDSGDESRVGTDSDAIEGSVSPGNASQDGSAPSDSVESGDLPSASAADDVSPSDVAEGGVSPSDMAEDGVPPIDKAEEGALSNAMAHGDVSPSRSAKRKVTAIVIAVIAVIAAVVIGVAVKVNMDARATEEANAALHSIHVSITAPAYNDASTRIPVNVAGKTVGGEAVDKLVFLGPDGTGLELARGTYELSFPGGYFTEDGAVCRAPDTVVKVDVSGEGAGETSIAVTDEEVSYQVVPAAQVPDELVNEIAELAKQDQKDGDAADKVDKLAQKAVEKREAAREEQQRIEAEKARAEQIAQMQRELDQAYAENPSVVYCAPSKASEMVTLTGMIDVREGYAVGTQTTEDVCMLVLPNAITVTGTQYGDQTNDIIILGNSFAGYQGQVVTVNTRLGVRATASIASAQFSMLTASDTSIVRVFDMPEANGVNMAAAFTQTACDAAMALFTNARRDNGGVTLMDSQVAQYLAEGSPAAAEFSNGWNPDRKTIAVNAQVVSLDGNTFTIDVTFETAAANMELVKAYIARTTLTFDENGKITDIAVADFV